MDTGGFVPIDKIVEILFRRSRRDGLTKGQIQQAVGHIFCNDEKGRFELIGWFDRRRSIRPYLTASDFYAFGIRPRASIHQVCEPGDFTSRPSPTYGETRYEGQPPEMPADLKKLGEFDENLRPQIDRWRTEEQCPITHVLGIRCVQGTSMNFLRDDRLMFPVDPLDLPSLFHGTFEWAILPILADGLVPGGDAGEDHRSHVYLSPFNPGDPLYRAGARKHTDYIITFCKQLLFNLSVKLWHTRAGAVLCPNIIPWAAIRLIYRRTTGNLGEVSGAALIFDSDYGGFEVTGHRGGIEYFTFADLRQAPPLRDNMFSCPNCNVDCRIGLLECLVCRAKFTFRLPPAIGAEGEGGGTTSGGAASSASAGPSGLGSAAASASAYETPASAQPAGSSSSGGAAGVGAFTTVAVSDFIDLSFAPGGSLIKEDANVAGLSLVTPTMSGALDDQIPTGLVTREERQAALGLTTL